MRRKTEYLLFRWLCPHHYILLMGVSAFLAFVCGYAISVGTGKVAALFPYISDTGTTTPASSIFGLFLNLSAVFGAISVFIRHSHMECLLDSHRKHIVNDVAMFLGLLICLGTMMVANFPWTKVIVPHLIGALLVFVIGDVYCWLQCYITYTIHGTLRSLRLIIRVMLSFSSSVTLILTILFARLAGEKGIVGDKLKWKSNEPGYSDHITSTFSEWIMVIAILLYFFTFYDEFKCLESQVNVRTKTYEDVDDREQTSYLDNN